MGIGTVAVYSDADRGEPHMREADEAVRLPGVASRETYLNIDAIVDAALHSDVDAVHPGYGFLAENAAFASAVEDAGLIWIGPPAKAIEIMGSKLESKRLMRQAHVPTLDSLELTGETDLAEAADSIGYPVLVKASAGGGGKGMRIVAEAPDLAGAVEGARREAASAFGDDTVFLEKYLEAPHHVEIQVFGDNAGDVIAIYERECSIQRRHQKIIEEAPSPAIDGEIRRAMSEAAINAAKAVDYVGAGTVEFLFQGGEFFFLEMNTRLQVEHPVTEMITRLDLVRLQIEIAEGTRVPDKLPQIDGHAIEARLYAEDPLNDYLPVTGKVHDFHFDDSPGLRVDAGVEAGSLISVHYDPMIAKVVAHAPTREAAAASLAMALRKARLHTSTTNRDLLVRILESDEFLAGETDTHFLERHDVSRLAAPLAGPEDERLAAVACAIADQALARSEAKALASIPSGWRNMPSQRPVRTYEGFHGTHEIEYSVGPDGFEETMLGHIQVVSASPSVVVLAVNGHQERIVVSRYGEDRYVDRAGAPAHLSEVPRYPAARHEEAAGSLHAPMPGKVIGVTVTEGDSIEEGQILVTLEAMKMEHTLRAPHSGKVTSILHEAGDQVEGGAVLVVISDD